MKSLFLISIILMLYVNFCYSQQKKVKWGIVSDEEIEIKSLGDKSARHAN